MAIKVRLRLPVPEGKAGSTVTVSEQRAKLLVDSRYAYYVETAAEETAPAQAPSVGTAGEGEQAPAEPASTTDYTTLPSTGDLKEEWENAATALNIDLRREDGSDKNKAELIKEVQAAVGADE